jgi:zona occludens toxin
MIFGSEGLPRSGKSLESMQHIVDSLIKGRTVVTNIHGIDKKAMSEYCVIPLPTVERLLITLDRPPGLDEEQVVSWTKKSFLENAVTDSLWIWDEINQFWPPDRQPLPADWAKFVTEHGHLGIDILIMGQDLTELHTTWRKRLQRYTRYTKLDMMGKEDSFHWASYSNAGRNRFKRTSEGKKPYKKEFFPLYKSHRDETQNKDNYKDKRYGIFQTKHKIWGVIFVLILFSAFYYLYNFFQHPHIASRADGVEQAPVHVDPKPAKEEVKVKQPEPTDSPVGAVAAAAKPEPIDYFDKLATKYDLRLSAILERTPYDGDTRPWLEFQIDALDSSYRVKERFNRASIVALGWTVERTDYGIKLSKQDVVYVVRPWPLDNFGKVSNKAIADQKPNQQASQLAEPPAGRPSFGNTLVGNTGQRFTVVEDTSRVKR